METLQTLLLVLQVLVAISLIGIILLQHGKGADAGAAFGSGASSTVFGAAGAGNFLSRTTAILAFIFLANSLGLAYLASQRVRIGGGSLMDQPVTEVQRVSPPADVISEIPAAPAAAGSEVPVEPSSQIAAPGEIPAEPDAGAVPSGMEIDIAPVIPESMPQQ